MSAYVNMGDKVNAGASVAGAITLSHQQNVFLSDSQLTAATPKTFTITSVLIDANTVPVVSAYITGGAASFISAAIGTLTPTAETLNSGGFAASITPGTLTFTLTATVTTTGAANPTVCVNFL